MSLAARAAVSTVALTLALAACSGSNGSSVPAGGTQPATHGRATAEFAIAIPKANATSAAKRRAPLYVSPATASMTIAITTSVGASVISETVALTVGSNGCTSTLASTVCTLTLSFSPGSYVASIATYDGYNVATQAASGNELSAAQAVPFTVIAGSANVIHLTLSGIPAALLVDPGPYGVRGSQSAGFTFYGSTAQKLIVAALDADGDFIVGPGAPTFTITAAGGSGYAIAQPTATTPNAFALTPPSVDGESEAFSVSAAYADDTCSLQGAVCSTGFSVTNHLQTVFLANYGNNTVTTYRAPYSNSSAPIATMSSGVNYPISLALDAENDLIVANRNYDNVVVYALPYTEGSPTATIPVNAIPFDVAFDPSGNLVVANNQISGSSTVTVFAPPFTSASTPFATFSTGELECMSVDASGNVYVGYVSGSVSVYSPPFSNATTAAASVSSGGDYPNVIAFDAVGDVFVASYPSTVYEYAPPVTGGGPIAVISTGVNNPQGLTVDPSGDVYVSNRASNTVTIYPPPYTTTTPVTISSGVNTPQSVAVDGAGNLLVSNLGNNTLTVYQPPFSNSSAPVATISSGVNEPYGHGILRVSP